MHLIQRFFKNEGQRLHRSPLRYVSLRLGALIGLGLISGLALYFAVRAEVFGKLPTDEQLRTIQNFTASEVYTYDRILLGRYYVENRTNTTLDNINPAIAEALIATEDARFYEHNGVDRRSLARVLVKSILLRQENSGGGSTISQQLAKNLFPRQRYSLLTMPVNKIKEITVATRLEKMYSKDEILMLYLNTVPFGGNVFGIEAAAKRFFNKSAKELSTPEAATLIGMLKATTYYSPRLYPDRSRQRRNVVLSQMARYDYLTASQRDSLQALPLEINYNNVTHNTGLAPYFREKLRGEIQQWLNKHPKEDGSIYNLYTDGLKIYTTLDARLQKHAEQAVAEHLKKLQKDFFAHWKDKKPWGDDDQSLQQAKRRSERYRLLKSLGKSDGEIDTIFSTPIPMTVFTWEGEQEKTLSPMDSIAYYQMFLNAGFLAIRPENGQVKAWVGGIDHKYFQYDHVTARRQVGSTFKPIVYAAALEDGAQPCDFIKNEQRVYADYDDWSPGNSDGDYEGSYSMAGALAKSVNTVTVELMMRTGVENVVDLAHRMGIESPLPDRPAIALGTADLSLYEMLTVYGTLVNRGVRVKPSYLLGIEDKDGNVIVKFNDKPEAERALSRETADLMVNMLKNVTDTGGTARRLRYTYKLRNDLIGKTGTTQSHADGWFIGATPKLVFGSWVGADNRLVRFRTISEGQGANTALPIAALFLDKFNRDETFKNIRYARFPEPSRSVLAQLNCPMYEEDRPGLFERIFADKDEKNERDPNGERRVADQQRPEYTGRDRSERAPRRPPRERKKLKDVLRDIFGGN